MKSLFFVPSNRPDFFKKASVFDCDVVIFDLEDAIAPDQINQGLSNIRNLAGLFKGEQKKYIRIDRSCYEPVLDALPDLPVNGYVIPKFETAEVLDSILRYDAKAEIVLLIETVKGFQRLSEGLVPEVKNIKGLAFGAEDYCQSMGCTDNFFNLLFARTRLLETARMLGIEAYDTIYPGIRDNEGFLKSLIKTREMGFDGKMLIHPGQLDIFNKEKSSDILLMKAIVSEYGNNLKNGITVSVINGRIYERNHIEHMKSKIRRMEGESE